MRPESQHRNPYVGPRPFELEDKELFFGRDREISEVQSLIIASRVLLLYARSGAGKTSLINAGLIPRLLREGFEVLPPARVRGEIPEDLPVKEISNVYAFNALVGWAEDGDDDGDDLGRLARMSLADFLKEREHPTDADGLPSPRVVIFDQFEEIFTSYAHRWRDREGFFRQVAEALEEDALLRLVFVMREDYIAQLDPYAHLLPDQLRTQSRLERLGKEAAIAAVKGPLLKSRPPRKFEDGVAEALVEDLMEVRVETDPGTIERVSGQFVEPVQLQVVCDSLWRDLPPDVSDITEGHFRAFGDVDQALTRFYERSLTAAQGVGAREGDLRSLFEHSLITPAGTRGTVFRGRERTGARSKEEEEGVLDKLLYSLGLKRGGGIPNEALDVLDRQHLIRGESRAGARWYELTHDRLIEPIQESNKTWRERTAKARMRRIGAGVALVVPLLAAIGIAYTRAATDENGLELKPGAVVDFDDSFAITDLLITPPAETDCDALGLGGRSILIDPGINQEEVLVDRMERTDEGLCRIIPAVPLRLSHEAGDIILGQAGSVVDCEDRCSPSELLIAPPVGTSCEALRLAGLTILVHPGVEEEPVDVRSAEVLGEGRCLIISEEPIRPSWEVGETVLFEAGALAALSESYRGLLVIVPLVGTGCDLPGLGGRTLVVDPGGDNEEQVEVASAEEPSEGLCTLVPTEPLNSDHEVGEKVILVLQNLTNNSADDHFPAWSPNSDRIAFVSERDGNSEIYVMNDDGSGLTRLTDDPANEVHPAWSPDGDRIAFFSDRDGNAEIYVMNDDGSGLTRLTDNPADDFDPGWSSYDRIAFVSERDGNSEIYVMNDDGSGLTRLTDDPANEVHPAWSPEGGRIAFFSDRDGNAEIYVMNDDGSGLTRLTDNPADDFDPGWSSDDRIAFTSNRDGQLEVYVMNGDGSGLSRLTDNPADDFDPAWSSDDRIAFTSNRDGNFEIYVLPLIYVLPQ